MAVIQFRRPGRTDGQEQYDNDRADFDEEVFAEESERNTAAETAGSARRSRGKRLLRTLLLVALFAAGAYLIYYVSSTRSYAGASYTKAADMITQEGTWYEALGGSVVSYSADGASCMDASGKSAWSITYEMQQPMVSVNGTIIAIGDYNGSEIHVLNSQKELCKINTNMPLRALYASAGGEVAAVLADTKATWIYLYKADGSEIAYFKTTMKQSGYPAAVAISPKGQLAGVSFLTMGSTQANSSIAFYNFGAVGQNTSENNVAGFNFDNQIFPYLTFLDATSSVGVSDSQIVFFNGDEIPEQGKTDTFGDAQVEAVYTGDKLIAVVLAGAGDKAQHTMRIYNAAGEKVSQITFGMEYTDVQIANGHVFVYNAQQLQVYSPDGTKKYDGEFKMDVVKLIPSAGQANKMLLVTENSLESMTLE